MKSVLISIQPKWVEKIANGQKTIEVRKTAPKQVPFKAYIYCTSSDVHSALVVGDGDAKLIRCCNYKSAIPVGGAIGNGKVIGEFVCDNAEWMSIRDCDKACMTLKEAIDYGKGKKLYAWHISDLKIYDEPKELSEFYRICKNPCKPSNGGILCLTTKSLKMNGCDGKIPLTRAPQSWQYVEELEE